MEKSKRFEAYEKGVNNLSTILPPFEEQKPKTAYEAYERCVSGLQKVFHLADEGYKV